MSKVRINSDAKRDDGYYHTRFLSTPVYEYLLDAAGGEVRVFACPSSIKTGADYLLPSSPPPNGLGWQLDYVNLFGFDHTRLTYERSGQDLTLTNGQPAQVVKALLS